MMKSGKGILFIPSLIKTDIYRNIPDDIAFFKFQVVCIRNRRELAVILIKFQRDPVVSSGICLLNCFIQSLALSETILKIRENPL